MIDCGLWQGTEILEERNFDRFEYNPAEIEFLLITHAHMDHIGRVPKLVKDGFKGKIISTPETKELAEPMLSDAMKVLKARHRGRILFDEEDIKKAMSLWSDFDYGEKTELFPNCFLEMQNAGHILGSAILSLELSPPNPPLTLRGGQEGNHCASKKIKIAFTGDLGNSPSPLLPDTEIPMDIDYLIIESVYGDRNHESKKERREKLKEAIQNGIKKEGTIVIPTFSIERTQVLLYEINNMIEDGEIPEVPVFFDSPLATKVTEIYKRHFADLKKAVKEEIKSGDNIFDFPGLKIVKTRNDSGEIKNVSGAKIILAGSGMSEGGRVVNHEIDFLPDPKATIILIGYQAIGTLGRLLQDGAKEVEIRKNEEKEIWGEKGGELMKWVRKEKIKVRAKIEKIGGYSSHKDSEHLLEFVEKTSASPRAPLLAKERGEEKKPKCVFVIMGEPKSSLFLSQRIREYLDIEAIYPEENKKYELK